MGLNIENTTQVNPLNAVQRLLLTLTFEIAIKNMIETYSSTSAY